VGFNYSSKLWPDNVEAFFRNRDILPIKQKGPHCVSTVLAMIAGISSDLFNGKINTQNLVVVRENSEIQNRIVLESSRPW